MAAARRAAGTILRPRRGPCPARPTAAFVSAILRPARLIRLESRFALLLGVHDGEALHGRHARRHPDRRGRPHPAHPFPLPVGARPREGNRRGGTPCLLHGADARAREQREGDDGNLPEIDLVEFSDAALRIDTALDGAEADREAIDRTGLDQRDQLAPARDFRDEPAARETAALVL